MNSKIEGTGGRDANAGEHVSAARSQSDRRGYLTTADAATYLGFSPRTLEKHRCYGTGPIFQKLGGKFVYRIEQLDSWAELGTRRSTSDPGIGVVLPAKRVS